MSKKSKKCAHIPCRCPVAEGEEYCGDACRLAGSGEVEVLCECHHPPCLTTAGS